MVLKTRKKQLIKKATLPEFYQMPLFLLDYQVFMEGSSGGIQKT
ncbi:MAG: hypothetical protein R6U68_16115 [Desulfobacteraceae bacterium]